MNRGEVPEPSWASVKKAACDLTRIVNCFGAGSCEMTAKKPARRSTLKPLENGQIWRLGEFHLKVEMIGKLLVEYRLAKPKAVRTPISICGIATLKKYMRKNKAVLIHG